MAAQRAEKGPAAVRKALRTDPAVDPRVDIVAGRSVHQDIVRMVYGVNLSLKDVHFLVDVDVRIELAVFQGDFRLLREIFHRIIRRDGVLIHKLLLAVEDGGEAAVAVDDGFKQLLFHLQLAGQPEEAHGFVHGG